MSRRLSSIALSASVLLIASGAFAAPAQGPVEKRWELWRDTDHLNAKKPKPKKDADAEEAAEEEEPKEKKGKKAKGKKGKKDADEPADEAEEEKPKKKGKKAKKEELEEEEPKEEPKKKGKGKKGKKEEPPPEEEPVDLKETESPTAEETPEEPPTEEETPAEPPKEESEESSKSEASASVSTADAAGKLYLGLRLGFGIPMGDPTGDNAIKFSNKIPIWLDLGYKITPSFLIGLYGQYAFAGIDQCYSDATCSAHVVRFGVQVQYDFMPEGKFDPWVGLGVGYEMAGGTISVPGQGEASFDLKGFEFANLQAGGDFKLSPAVGIGPFVSFSLGRYASAELSEGGATASGGIVNKTMHEWLVFGVRGAFTL